MWITGPPQTDGDVSLVFQRSLDPVDSPDPVSEHSDDRRLLREKSGGVGRTQLVKFSSAGPEQCYTVPTVRNLFWTGSCSKFWTGRGTSSVSSAANANVV